jgi:hypothetical protein
MATPAPRSTVRRERCFLVKYIEDERILLGYRPG